MIKNKDKRVINKDEFYHLVAKEANFTLNDIKKIWHVIENIFTEIIEKDYILDLPGFGKLYISNVVGKNSWDNIHKKTVFIPPTKRVVLKLSNNLRKITSNKKK